MFIIGWKTLHHCLTVINFTASCVVQELRRNQYANTVRINNEVCCLRVAYIHQLTPAWLPRAYELYYLFQVVATAFCLKKGMIIQHRYTHCVQKDGTMGGAK